MVLAACSLAEPTTTNPGPSGVPTTVAQGLGEPMLTDHIVDFIGDPFNEVVPDAETATVEVEVVVRNDLSNGLVERPDDAGGAPTMVLRQVIYRVVARAGDSVDGPLILDRIVTHQPMTIHLPPGDAWFVVGDWDCDMPCTQMSPNHSSCSPITLTIEHGTHYQLGVRWRTEGPPTCSMSAQE